MEQYLTNMNHAQYEYAGKKRDLNFKIRMEKDERLYQENLLAADEEHDPGENAFQ